MDKLVHSVCTLLHTRSILAHTSGSDGVRRLHVLVGHGCEISYTTSGNDYRSHTLLYTHVVALANPGRLPSTMTSRCIHTYHGTCKATVDSSSFPYRGAGSTEPMQLQAAPRRRIRRRMAMWTGLLPKGREADGEGACGSVCRRRSNCTISDLRPTAWDRFSPKILDCVPSPIIL